MSTFYTDPQGRSLALNAATARDLKARAQTASAAPDLVPIDYNNFVSDGNTFALIGKAYKALQDYGRAHPEHRDEMERRAEELRLRLPMLGSPLSEAEQAILNDGAPRTQDTALQVMMEYIDPLSSDDSEEDNDSDDLEFEGDDDDDDEWDEEDA